MIAPVQYRQIYLLSGFLILQEQAENCYFLHRVFPKMIISTNL